jgi:thioredoxin reductase
MLLIRIGAGIAGLTAALALKDKGLESSTIYAPKSAGEDTEPRTCPTSAPPRE